MKKMNKKLLLLIIGLSIIALIGMSYAYLASTIVGNEDDKIYVKTEQYGIIKVVYDTTYSEISINSLDLNNDTSGQTLSYMMKFYLTNIGDKTSEINIKWDDITNNFCQYRNENYECVDPSGSEYYVGDELRASLYECDSSGYALTNIATIKSTCTKISVSDDKALPLTGSTEKLNTSLISVAKNALKYYIVIVDIDNLTTNQNYQQEKSVTLGVQVEFNVKKIADAIYAEYTPLSDASIDFSYTSAGCNDATACTAGTIEDANQVTNGLYVNNKVTQYRINNENTNPIYANDPTAGTIKYFRGNVNNYVSFAGMLWRVIRINSDGSVKIITQNTPITSVAYNLLSDDVKYSGYTYDDTNTDRLDGNAGTDSNAKILLTNWFQTNLSSYQQYINLSASYCNDTSKMNATSYGYGAYLRNFNAKTPSFHCPEALFTYGGIYNVPIATITADEAAYAGNVRGMNPVLINNNYYLYNNTSYWTLSPDAYWNNGIALYTVFGNGTGATHTNNLSGLRPVIELKATTIVLGSGSSTDPWVVQ